MAFHLPVGAVEIARRTVNEILEDDGLGLAAQLAYYFFLSLFPALLFLLAIASFFALGDLTQGVVAQMGTVLPSSAMSIIQDQLARIAERDQTGLLTIGVLGAFWSTSTALVAIINAMNQAYDVEESRSFWQVRLLAIGLTIVLAGGLLGASAIIIGGGIVEWLGLARLGPVWDVVQWPLALSMVVGGLIVVYRYAPDAEQTWFWCWPGAVLATGLWLAASLAFRYYVSNFGTYTETYGAVGGVIVMLLWFYLLGLAIVSGAELNSEIEHASTRADSKNPGGRAAGQGRPQAADGEAAAGASVDTPAAAPAAKAAAPRPEARGARPMVMPQELTKLRAEVAATRMRIDDAARDTADQVRAELHPRRLIQGHPAIAAGALAAVAASGAWWWHHRRNGDTAQQAALPDPARLEAEVERPMAARVAALWPYVSFALGVVAALRDRVDTNDTVEGARA